MAFPYSLISLKEKSKPPDHSSLPAVPLYSESYRYEIIIDTSPELLSHRRLIANVKLLTLPMHKDQPILEKAKAKIYWGQ